MSEIRGRAAGATSLTAHALVFCRNVYFCFLSSKFTNIHLFDVAQEIPSEEGSDKEENRKEAASHCHPGGYMTRRCQRKHALRGRISFRVVSCFCGNSEKRNGNVVHRLEDK